MSTVNLAKITQAIKDLQDALAKLATPKNAPHAEIFKASLRIRADLAEALSLIHSVIASIGPDTDPGNHLFP